jgi:hypothetical protein
MAHVASRDVSGMRIWTSKESYVIKLEAGFLRQQMSNGHRGASWAQLARTELSTSNAGPLVDGRLITVDGMIKSPLLVDRAKMRLGST